MFFNDKKYAILLHISVTGYEHCKTNGCIEMVNCLMSTAINIHYNLDDDFFTIPWELNPLLKLVSSISNRSKINLVIFLIKTLPIRTFIIIIMVLLLLL